MAETKSKAPPLGRRDLLLLLIGLGDREGFSEGLGGITRLQKLLFLLGDEEGVVPTTGEGFDFEAYKAGPYSRVIYDDLELLENLGFLRSETTGEMTAPEAAELDNLSFEHLMGDEAAEFTTELHSTAQTADTFEERRLSLTERGLHRIKELLAKANYEPYVHGIRSVKSRYARYSLQDLLYYVYTKYDKEGWTSESEIREQVLRRGRRR